MITIKILLTFSLLISTSLFADLPDDEYQALIKFYDSLGIEKYEFSMNECDREEVICVLGEDEYEHVQGLSFTGQMLEGNIPFYDLGQLYYLDSLWLGNNNLSKTDFENLELLTKIRVISLSNSNLQGTIPKSIGELKNLAVLYLDNNNLEGEIPSEIAGATKLGLLNLRNNQLSGNIPASLGNLLSLNSIILDRNLLYGEIPESFKNLIHLENLVLFHNQLTGNIPNWLGSLTYLKSISLKENRFYGVIPESIGNIFTLEELDLNSNNLVGEIPESMSHLSNLNYLNLSYNGLFTTSNQLNQFLSNLESDWNLTQTIAPKNLQANPITNSNLTYYNFSWDQVDYLDPGNYKIWIQPSPDVDFQFFAETNSKEVLNMLIKIPTTQIYSIGIQTVTLSNENNQNIVESMMNIIYPKNNPSIEANDDFFLLQNKPYGSCRVLSVLRNDRLEDHLVTIIYVSSTKEQGDVKISSDGQSVIYCPKDNNWYGKDDFEYTITDGKKYSTAEVKIQITRVSR